MCLNPKLIKNKRYLPNAKNGGIPPICDDERKLKVPVGCGLCIECRKQKANNWRIRIAEELKENGDAMFVTFSFSNESIEHLENEWRRIEKSEPDANDVATLGMRRFLERIRKLTGKSIKHIAFTELGQENTERIHLHAIFWDIKKYMVKNKWGLNHSPTLTEKWSYGNCYYGDYCNEKTANYIVKYILKTDPKHNEFIPKVLCSKGIGKRYIGTINAKNNEYNGTETREYYRFNNGAKGQLPIYYRNKIYTEEQRDNLWTNLLDKEIRFVMCIKIDVSTEKGMKEYEKSCEYWSGVDARHGNTQQKYKLKKDRIKYKAQIRYLAHQTKFRKQLENDIHKSQYGENRPINFEKSVASSKFDLKWRKSSKSEKSSNKNASKLVDGGPIEVLCEENRPKSNP